MTDGFVVAWKPLNSPRVWYSQPLLHRIQPKPFRFRAQSPEPPGRFSLRLDVYSPPQVLQIDGRLCHLVLAFLVVGDVTNSRAPSLHGRYPVPGGSTRTESRAGRIGPISLGAEQTGERSAGNPHAAFDEAGAGNAARSRWCDTRRRKSEPTGNTNFDLERSPNELNHGGFPNSGLFMIHDAAATRRRRRRWRYRTIFANGLSRP